VQPLKVKVRQKDPKYPADGEVWSEDTRLWVDTVVRLDSTRAVVVDNNGKIDVFFISDILVCT
jgi:hypothetical protein